jgi:hypothetical protein
VCNLQRPRFVAPAIHACLFALAYAFWLLFERGTHNNARLDLFALLWFADLPISVLTSILTMGSHKNGGVAFGLWGVLGTVWWYFLGISMEAWVGRIKKPKRDAA